MSLDAGDTVRFRLQRTANGTHLTPPDGGGLTYTGSEWTLTATIASASDTATGADAATRQPTAVTVGRMFFEDAYGGVSRLQAFHEHIGCTPCAAFYESEVRRGPWVLSQPMRSVSGIGFTPPEAQCQLFDVDIRNTTSGGGGGVGVLEAQFRTGPGTGPPRVGITVQ